MCLGEMMRHVGSIVPVFILAAGVTLALLGGCKSAESGPKELELAREMKVCVNAFRDGGMAVEQARSTCTCFLPTIQDKIGDLRFQEFSPIEQAFAFVLLGFCKDRFSTLESRTEDGDGT